MSITRNEVVHGIHEELMTHHAEYFESRLAYTVIRNANVLKAVKNVSDKMLETLQAHREHLVSSVLHDIKIKIELYDSSVYGRLRAEVDYTSIASANIYQDLIEHLADPDCDLSKLMQIHSVCIYRIFRALSGVSLGEAGKQGFDQCRIESEKSKATLTYHFGICRHLFFKSKLNIMTECHVASLHRFLPDVTAERVREMRENTLPFVSGFSGHAFHVFRGLMRLGFENTELLREYTLAYFAFLAGSGNHSFHEVMQVASDITAISYQPGQYDDCLPQSFKNTIAYQELKDDFPQYLEKTSSQRQGRDLK